MGVAQLLLVLLYLQAQVTSAWFEGQQISSEHWTTCIIDNPLKMRVYCYGVKLGYRFWTSERESLHFMGGGREGRTFFSHHVLLI